MLKKIRKIEGKVLLKDLQPISAKEYELSAGVREQIGKIIEERSAYIKKGVCDGEIVNPDRNWKQADDNAAYNAFIFVFSAPYDTINNLRFFAPYFTGYQLMTFSWTASSEPIKKVPKNYDVFLDNILNKPDVFTRLFLKITSYMPDHLIAHAPKILGEIGWEVEGHPVNHDIYVYQERLNLLYESGIINYLQSKIDRNQDINILEIGAGYGGLAYFLKVIFPKANIFLVDIPESLMFSSLYLSITRAKYKHLIYDGADKTLIGSNKFDYNFIPNYLFDDLLFSNLKVDLAINTLSFAEMSEAQVGHYAAGIKKMLGTEGLLFEQNHKVTASVTGCNCKEALEKHFIFKKDFSENELVTLEKITLGTPTIWANQEIEKIIEEQYRPFKKNEWYIFLKRKRIKYFLSFMTWFWAAFNLIRKILKRIFGEKGYRRIVVLYNYICAKVWYVLKGKTMLNKMGH
jgi:putative sugar O-methyltransferase